MRKNRFIILSMIFCAVIVMGAVQDYGSSTNIGSGYVAASAQARNSSRAQIRQALRLGSTITGIQDSIILVVTPLSANADIQASMHYRSVS